MTWVRPVDLSKNFLTMSFSSLNFRQVKSILYLFIKNLLQGKWVAGRGWQLEEEDNADRDMKLVLGSREGDWIE
jgi:hypothetical protein